MESSTPVSVTDFIEAAMSSYLKQILIITMDPDQTSYNSVVDDPEVFPSLDQDLSRFTATILETKYFEKN